MTRDTHSPIIGSLAEPSHRAGATSEFLLVGKQNEASKVIETSAEHSSASEYSTALSTASGAVGTCDKQAQITLVAEAWKASYEQLLQIQFPQNASVSTHVTDCQL